MLLDLTMPLDEKTPAYPGDPPFLIEQIATIDKNGWNERRLGINSHTGTHIDAPFHMLPQGKKLEEYPLETFFGKARVVDIKKAGLKDVGEKIIFFFTGQTNKYQTPLFFKDNLVLTKEMAQQLIYNRVRIVGIDSFSIDNTPFEVHKMLFRHDILIVENLMNLGPLVGKAVVVMVVPLRLMDADGAPCRVVAKL